MLDPMISLVFSVYSGKGIHALLLGSGISSSSGIPTGWAITLDLIRKFAAVEEQTCGDDPEAWYREAYGKEPDYSELLQAVALESSERMNLLRSYFEPNEQEREEGRKKPTPAHHAIAKLVADGYIRVIVTTNFDRLMERALEEAGVVPSVVASTDAIRGAEPLAHARCTLIKLHGDYLDTRLKNTPDEIGQYDAELNRLLDQVFDEYGLIVSGWSAVWDVALRAALERCPNRRYTTYWSAYRDVSGIAKELCQKRAAQVIPGMGADEFFGKLQEKVATLDEMNAPHPLSASMAVAALKRYLPEDRYQIKLHDLVMGEADKVATALFSDLGFQRKQPTLKEYESPLGILLPLMAAAGFWGNARQRWLWLRCLEMMVTPRSGNIPYLTSHDYYPALLLLYAYGIGSLAAGRPGNLAYILSKGKVVSRFGDRSMAYNLVSATKFDKLDEFVSSSDNQYSQFNVPSSRHMKDLLRGPLKEFIPEDSRYEWLFCQYEYLLAIVCSWISNKRWGEDRYPVVPGLYLSKLMPRENSLPEYFDKELDKHGDRWPFLRAGLFDKSLESLKEIKGKFEANARSAAFRLSML